MAHASSTAPLATKLGIRAGSQVLAVAEPGRLLDRLLQDLPPGVTVHRRPGRSPYDVVVLFAADRRELADRFALAAGWLTTAGGLWVCWPKRSSGVATDLTDSVVREHGLAEGLVDVKVCSVDDTWSGLRFVVRLADRAANAGPST